MPTLYLTRPGITPPPPVFGHVLTIPSAPSASQQPDNDPTWLADLLHLIATDDEDALMDRLGHTALLAGVGKPDHVQLIGLHEPTPWERRFAHWAQTKCGVATPIALDAATDLPANFSPLAAALADPVLPWPDKPLDRLNLVVGATPTLEALGVVRAIRAWLLDHDPTQWPELADDLLVLLPAGTARLTLWQRALERHGLPVQTTRWIRLADTAVGRWLMSVCDLAGWRDDALDRDTLRAMLMSPMWVLGEQISRSDLRTLVRALRRPTVTLAQWEAHVGGHYAQLRRRRRRRGDADAAILQADLDELTQREDAIIQRVRSWLEVLGDVTSPGFWKKLLSLLGSDRKSADEAPTKLRVTARVRASANGQNDEASLSDSGDLSNIVIRCKAVLETLSHAGEAGTLLERRDALRRGLASSSVRVGATLRHGVRLQTYASWDGRGAAWTVLAGLEEGGHPCAPAPLSADDRQLSEAMRGLTPTQELQRQARITSRAAALTTDRLTLSWPQTDMKGSDTFPGALLAGRPELSPWSSEARKEVARAWLTATTYVGERDAVPAALGDALAPGDLLLFPVPTDATGAEREQGGRETDGGGEGARRGEERALIDQWQHAAAAAEGATSVAAERAGVHGADGFGPFTGRVGVPVRADSYSPTALEDLGQCATKYFLARVLGAKKTDDAGVFLDASETGSMLHDAMAEAAQSAIADGDGWSLAAPGDGEETVAWVEQRLQQVRVGLSAITKEIEQTHPTLSTELLAWVVDRWVGALRPALRVAAETSSGGLFEPGPAPDVMEVSDEDLLAVTDVLGITDGNVLRDIVAGRQNRATAHAVIGRAKSLEFSTATSAKGWYDTLTAAEKKAVGKGAFAKAATTSTPEGWAALTSSPIVTASKLATARTVFERGFRADRMAVPRTVVAAEWQFGRPRSEGDGADPASTGELLQIDLGDGKVLPVAGRLDRLDGDLQRGDLAVVDYKSGKSKGDEKLTKEVGQGLHLQLPLYALAAEQLFAPKHVPGPARVEVGRLEFIRVATEATLSLADDHVAWQEESDGEEDAEPYTTRDVVRQHLAHSEQRLQSGVLPLMPRKCPKLKAGAYCDFSSVCGFDVDAVDRFADPAPQPAFTQVGETGKGSGEGKTDTSHSPEHYKPVEEPPEAEAAHGEQAQACQDALQLDKDIVVSAGAGAGKTRLLVDRYLAALKSGCTPDEVLAITFTRKATAEMRYRVRRALLERRDEFGDEDTFRASLLGIGAAPILTIDAFADRIHQQFSDDELQISTNLSEFRTAWLEKRLLEAVVHAQVGGARTTTEAKALATLLDAWPMTEVRAALDSLLAHPAALAGLAETSAADIATNWQQELDRGATGWRMAKTELEAAAQHARAFVAGQENVSQTLEDWAIGLERACSAADNFSALGLVWGLTQVGREPGKKQAADILETVATVKRLKATWGTKSKTTGKLSDALKSCKTEAELRERLTTEAQLTAAAIALARAWQQAYQADKAERHLASFGDILARAVAILTTAGTDAAAFHSDFRARFGYRHVLVDEFQDTSSDQVQLIEGVRAALAATGEPPRLFLVGDPKQSIYRFRGAEVDVFEQQLNQRADDRIQLILPVGKRSRPALTRSLDRLFERVLRAHTDDDAIADPGAAVPWQPLAPRWQPDDADDDGDDNGEACVELLELASAEADAETDAHADADTKADDADSEHQSENDSPVDRQVAARVKALLAEMLGRHAGESARSPVAVLTHSWARAQHWVAVLQRADVPVFIQGGRGLLDNPDVRPLMAVLDALEAQDDDIAWLGMLRGPMVAVSDATLLCLRRGFGLQLRDWSKDEGATETDVLAGTTGPDGARYKPAGARTRMSTLRHGFLFSSDAALAQLQELNGAPVAVDIAACVRDDATKLARLLSWWLPIARSYGLIPLDQTVRALLAKSHYASVLNARGGLAARQALASMRTFAALVESVAEEPGRLPGDVIRELRRRSSTNADPAAGGGNLHAGRAVTVTVVHQAKGLEWDCVVLPDLDRAVTKNRMAHVTPVRLVSEEAGVTWLPGSRLAKSSDPFATEAGIGSCLVQFLALPSERAESRRLLYVACTRAKERLVLGIAPHAVKAGAEEPADEVAARDAALETDVVSFRMSKNWLDDFRLALRAKEGDAAVWQLGRDFVWSPAASDDMADDVAQSMTEATTADAAPQMVAWQNIARTLPPEFVHIVNPSKIKSTTPPADAETLAAAAGSTAPETKPFDDPRREGTAVHRAFELWGYRGEMTGSAAQAAVDEIGTSQTCRGAQAAHVRAMVAHASRCQPGLVEELREARERGEMLHEVVLRLDLPIGAEGDRLEGSIDLLYRDRGGLWHLLDYKASEIEVDEEKAGRRDLAARSHHYYPQVKAYADSVQRVLPAGERLATFGLWFVKDGSIVRWRVS